MAASGDGWLLLPEHESGIRRAKRIARRYMVPWGCVSWSRGHLCWTGLPGESLLSITGAIWQRTPFAGNGADVGCYYGRLLAVI